MRRLNPLVPPHTSKADRLHAVVLDWAGTTVDHGSLAPARTLQRLFARVDIQLSDSEMRRDMGLPKKEHIRAILGSPRVRELWQQRHGVAPREAEVDLMYEEFIPLQLACLSKYSSLIPGVLEAVHGFRSRGLKVGSTTGYSRAMLDLLLEQSAAAGYRPDCSLAPEDVGAGRPHPFMMYETAVRLKVSPTAAMAKIGDTPVDMQEALNAGAWAIGIAGTGNGVGLSRDQFQLLPAFEQELRLGMARAELQEAGAHYVVDTFADIAPVLDDIDSRLRLA